MIRTKSNWLVLFMLLVALPLSAAAQDKKKDKKDKKPLTGTPVFWHAPEDIEQRNLLLGAGGEQMKGGYSTKYRVRDAKGNEWVAKIGREAQPDTAANRLLWALGYETEICYLFPKLTIEGKGEFENVRLEARPANVKRTGPWMWTNNPFIDTPEFRALKILMVMIK